MSCVVLTQVLDHPGVKLYSEDRARGSVEGSVGGRVPDKYVLVRNNELAHIRSVQMVWVWVGSIANNIKVGILMFTFRGTSSN